jgi:hypothetical protein
MMLNPVAQAVQRVAEVQVVQRVGQGLQPAREGCRLGRQVQPWDGS